jgi:methyl-accepting chemotaxis protein
MLAMKAVYPGARQVLHWTLAGLVVTQIVIMLLFRSMQSLNFGQIVLGLHLNVGLAIIAVSASYVVFAMALKAPPSPEGTPGWQKYSALAVHILLVALVSAIAFVGVLTAWARGNPVPVLFLFDINAPFEPNYEQADQLLVLHGQLAWSLCALIAVHIGAVAFNGLVRRVNVLKRMLPAPEMRIFRNRLPIGAQLFAAFSVLVFVGAYVGLDALKHTKKMSEIAENTYDKTFLSLSHARSAQAHVKELIGLSASGANPERAIELTGLASEDMAEVVERAPAAAIKTGAEDVLARLKTHEGDGAFGIEDLKAIDVALEDVTLSLQGESFGARSAISKAAANAHDLIILAAVPTLTLAALAALAVWASIAGLVARLRHMTRAISNTEAAADISVVGNGELAGLMRDVLACRESFAAQRAEVSRLSAEVERQEEEVRKRLDHAIGSVVIAARAGDFSQRAPESEELGQFLRTAQGINAVCAEAERFLDSVDLQATALANGDLTRQITQRFEGRFAKVADNVNAATRTLREAVAEANASSGLTSERSQLILHNASDLARRGDMQAKSLAQTAAAMEEMTSSVAGCAENSRTAADVARQAAAKADESLGQVSSAIEAVDVIDKSSKQIAAVVSVIDEIAFQTRLLALNAAIEAARAGEAGRGFAVVAQEVRSLADGSASAAQDVRKLVAASSKQVQAGVSLVRATGVSFEEIVGHVREVASRIDEISIAMREQSRTVASLSKETANMDSMTQQNSDAAEQMQGAATELAEEASRLAGLVSSFRTSAKQPRALPAPSATLVARRA